MKQKFMEEREQESYDNHVAEAYYNHLLLLSQNEDETKEIINQIKK